MPTNPKAKADLFRVCFCFGVILIRGFEAAAPQGGDVAISLPGLSKGRIFC